MVSQRREEDRKAASEAASTREQSTASAGGVHKTVALVLTVFVVASLLYGLTETAIRAAALFVG
jgi:hypothetical protein